MPHDPEVFEEFILEAEGQLRLVEGAFGSFDAAGDEGSLNAINTAFRALHSVKGTAGFLGLPQVVAVCSGMENLLALARDRKETPGPEVVAALRQGAAMIGRMVGDIAAADEIDAQDLLDRLAQLDDPTAHPNKSPLSGRRELQLSPQLMEFLETFNLRPSNVTELMEYFAHLYLLRYNLTLLAQEKRTTPVKIVRELVQNGLIITGRIDAPSSDFTEGDDTGVMTYSVLVAASVSPVDAPATFGLEAEDIFHLAESKELESRVDNGAESSEVRQKEGGRERTIWSKAIDRRNGSARIRVAAMNKMARLTDDLSRLRNRQLLMLDRVDDELQETIERLDVIANDMQDAMIALRMQPVGNLFNKFAQVTRDLGTKLGKRIELSVEGGEIELENLVIESLSAPLTHLVRNSCDHGVETPEERAAAGKSEVANITLAARHEGDRFVVEVRDDGRGIDPAVVRAKALEKGMDAEVARAGDDDERLVALVLKPGFSTASRVSDVSGRGVGMDVVQFVADRLGGTVGIDSLPGYGTVIRLDFPLSLKVVHALVVMVGGRRYALPETFVEELVCLYEQDVRHHLEVVGVRRMYRFNDRSIPMVCLGELLATLKGDGGTMACGDRVAGGQEGGDADTLTFVVLRLGEAAFGVMVESVIGAEELAVKMSHPEDGVDLFAGFAILEDGEIAQLLDGEALARHAGIVGAPPAGGGVLVNRPSLTSRRTVLLFEAGGEGRCAIPVEKVDHIQSVRLSPHDLDRGSQLQLLDGVSTLLVRLDDYLPVPPSALREEMYLILPKTVGGAPFGVLATALVDTVEVEGAGWRTKGQETVVIKGKMTHCIDIDMLAEKIASSQDREGEYEPWRMGCVNSHLDS